MDKASILLYLKSISVIQCLLPFNLGERDYKELQSKIQKLYKSRLTEVYFVYLKGDTYV